MEGRLGHLKYKHIFYYLTAFYAKAQHVGWI